MKGGLHRIAFAGLRTVEVGLNGFGDVIVILSSGIAHFSTPIRAWHAHVRPSLQLDTPFVAA
jgi:hypothetical protein